MTKRSEAMESILASAKALHRVGGISEERLTEFKKITARDLPQIPTVVEMTGENIKALREKWKMSQAAFAALINTKVGTLQKWESGANSPHGPALKLLNIADKRGLDFLIK